jgi:hypothetical protein
LKKKTSKFTLEQLIYLFIILFSFSFVLKTGIIISPDSQGYLEMSLIRSCGYPFFIAFHRILFGEYYIEALLITQFGIIASASFYLTQCIKKTTHLNKWFLLLLFIVLLTPILYEDRIANALLSEALAYSLYLTIVGSTLIAVINKKYVYFYFSFVLTYFLILVRGQFLFLIPVFWIAILISDHKLFFKKKNVLLVLTTFLIPALVIVTDVFYHNTKHNQETTTPWTGIQIVALPFFVSNQNDYTIFETPQQQDYFKYIYKKLNQKKLLLKHVPGKDDKIDFFWSNYVYMCNSTISDNGIDFFNKSLSLDQRTVLNDKMTTSLALPLIKKNLKEYSLVYIKNIFKGFHSSKNFLLFLIILSLGIFLFLKTRNTISKFIITTTIITFGNIVLVSAVEPTINRYVFYNNWTLIIIVLLLFQIAFIKKTNE